MNNPTDEEFFASLRELTPCLLMNNQYYCAVPRDEILWLTDLLERRNEKIRHFRKALEHIKKTTVEGDLHDYINEVFADE